MSRIRETTVAAPTSTLLPVQATALLSMLVLLWQFLSAGQMVAGEHAHEGHAAGAIILHVATGLLLVATVLYGRRTAVWWPTALAATVFVLTFVQAWLGSHGPISVHVPLALLITAGVVWLTAWSFRFTD